MTGAQTSLGGWRIDPDRRPELDDDPTPRPVVRAVLEALWASDALVPVVARWPRSPEPLRVLDLGAGFGAWSSEMRALAERQGWPVHITGVEINESRREHLAKWCDEVAVCDWRHVLRSSTGLGPPWPVSAAGLSGFTWDLIVGNPPFAHLLAEGKDTDHLPPEQTMVPTLLEHAPAVLLLHTQQALLKSECGRAVQRLWPPAAAWQVPGAVAFRGDGKADSRCYEATLWLRDHSGPCQRYLLPELEASERRWTVPPGSESPEVARANGWPLAPGYGEP